MSDIKWPKCSSCGDEDFLFKSDDEFTVEIHSDDAMTIITQCQKCGEYTRALLSYEVIEIQEEV